ncbi:MAG: hypothetical protein NT028_10520 [candidate division Zixibacteria bacterium]|nr:hypothetical protein [candidate division Zixibacteria bacterium]
MLRRLFWTIIGAIALCENCFSATALKYIEFATDHFNQLDSAIQAVEQSGATVVHIFPPNCVLAMLPESAQRLGENCVVYDSPASFRKSGKSPINEPAYMAWSHLYAGDTEVARNPGQIPAPLTGCVKYFADSTAAGYDPNARTSTPDLFTSNYLVGRIALSIILMESNGGDENWTQQQTNKTIAEIVQGTNFLSSRAAGFGVKVSWVYETHLSVPTNYEPIEGLSVPIDLGPPGLGFFWIDDALSFLGFSSQWDGVFTMANSLRKNYHANWGMSTFVVMDEHVPSHTFLDGKFAYVTSYRNYPTAAYNACFIVMTYNNGDWGPDAMDQVFRHEVGHIFRAPDEYYQAGYGGCEEDDCPKKYGYLQVNNGNCEHCNDHSVFCIMRQSAYE